MENHRLIDERSLAFDQLIAEKLRAEPALLLRARSNLDRWLQTCSPAARPALLEWQALLEGPFSRLLGFLTGTDEEARRLRQSSPFCGMLTPAERTAILRK